MDDQFLYRYFDEGGVALYNGKSNDWTRRLREHVRLDDWSGEIMSVTVERHPDLGSVLAAEAASIRAEHPRYNVQHNRPGIAMAELDAGGEHSAGDIILMIGLAVLAAYVLYSGAVVAMEKYRCWKAERDEFRAWKQARVEVPAADRVVPADEPVMSTESASVVVPGSVVVTGQELVPVAREPRPVIIPKPPAPTDGMPGLSPLVVAVAFAVMQYRQSRQGSDWTRPLWPPVPPVDQ